MNDKFHQFHLPRYILIILDKDLLENITVLDFGISKTIEDIIKQFLINFNQAIEVRKDDITGKWLGVLLTLSEPRLIWVQMVKHPFVPNSKVFALAKKFNTILEETIAGDCRSHILKPHVVLDDNNFDRNGNLSPEGLVTYWKIIDATMKDFNSGETKLQPKKKIWFVLSRITPSSGGSSTSQAWILIE